MRCVDCKYFNIQCNPIRGEVNGVHGFWDLGHARCEKHNLIVDFASRKKLNKLKCVEQEQQNE